MSSDNTGSISPRIRAIVLARDGFCRMCGASPADTTLHIDHIVPRSRGGSNEIDNLQALCPPCNLGKSDLPLAGLRPADPPQQDDRHPLLGKWVHSFALGSLPDRVIEYQGQVVNLTPEGFAFVQLYDWLMGAPSRLMAVALTEMYGQRWQIYASNAEMLQAYAELRERRRSTPPPVIAPPRHLSVVRAGDLPGAGNGGAW